MFSVPVIIASALVAQAKIHTTSSSKMKQPQRAFAFSQLVQPITKPITESAQNIYSKHLKNNPLLKPGDNFFLHAATEVKNLLPRQKDHRLPQAIGDVMTVFGIDGEECRQATMSKKWKPLYVSFANFQVGSCYQHGFTDSLGTETLQVPFQGDVPIKVFKKPDCNAGKKLRSPSCVMAASQPQIGSGIQPASEPQNAAIQLGAEPVLHGSTSIINILDVVPVCILMCIAIASAVILYINVHRRFSIAQKDPLLGP